MVPTRLAAALMGEPANSLFPVCPLQLWGSWRATAVRRAREAVAAVNIEELARELRRADRQLTCRDICGP